MKAKWITSLLLVASLAACKKDDNSPSNNPSTSLESMLVGNWTVTSIEANGSVDFQGTPVLFDAESTTIKNSYYQISNSPKTYSSRVEATLEVTTVLGTNQVPYGPVMGSDTWRTNGVDSIFVMDQGREVGYEVISITSNKLRVATEQEITFSGQSADADLEMVLVK